MLWRCDCGTQEALAKNENFFCRKMTSFRTFRQKYPAQTVALGFRSVITWLYLLDVSPLRQICPVARWYYYILFVISPRGTVSILEKGTNILFIFGWMMYRGMQERSCTTTPVARSLVKRWWFIIYLFLCLSSFSLDVWRSSEERRESEKLSFPFISPHCNKWWARLRLKAGNNEPICGVEFNCFRRQSTDRCWCSFLKKETSASKIRP